MSDKLPWHVIEGSVQAYLNVSSELLQHDLNLFVCCMQYTRQEEHLFMY
jgi:hypothetical protein